MKKINKLVSMFALMGAMVAPESKGEEHVDVMDKVFGQERVAVTEINGVMVSLAKGYNQTIETTEVSTNGNQVTTTTIQKKVTYPILREANGQGFANGYIDLPQFADIAVNRDRNEIWASAQGNTNTLFKISLNGISTNNLLGSSMAIQPQVLRNGNTDDSGIAYATADKLITFGKWILAFDKAERASTDEPNTQVFHINGIVNNQPEWDFYSGVIPTLYCETTDTLYMTDGFKTVKLNKANPTAGVEDVATTATSGIVGLAALNGTLYQATSTAIYNGEKGVLSEPKITDGKIKYEELDLIQINGLTTDGENLIVSYNADANVVVSNLLLNKEIPVIAIQGASKVIASQNGIHALRNNQLIRIHD